jgi:glutathione S-transferase
MGSAPYLGGGFGRFYAYASMKIEYAIDRFAMEVKRQLEVLDRRLAASEYIAGSTHGFHFRPLFLALRRPFLPRCGLRRAPHAAGVHRTLVVEPPIGLVRS